MMKRLQLFVADFAILAFSSLLPSTSDPSPLQDFLFVNGKFCKDPNLANAEDFFYSGLNIPRNTSNPGGSTILVVLEGTLYVGFIISNTDNRLITKVLNPGDVFAFPVGLIHFQFNIGNTKAVAFAGLSSQNPGVITIANAVFGFNPPINPDVLTKAFQLDKNIVTYLQSKFWWDNN
ncbi:hypothetical protein ES332_D11G290100v1 [Gossypium tomentosum]|uniref:Germin-like protein n=1 Tax=Gossypium tomentosum TaxID=34277 RepID=A0A5D2IUP6_GOSTO|nr:hypothetical protein ES332_D11G290100v1 [Gossypium tomentosum]